MSIVVGVDLTRLTIGYSGGVGVFSHELTRALHESRGVNKIIIYCQKQDLDYFNHTFSGIEVIGVSLQKNQILGFFRRVAIYLFRSQFILSLLKNLEYRKLKIEIEDRCNLVYTPTTYLNFYSKLIPTVVSLHDIQHKAFPDFFSKKQKTFRELATQITLNRATAIQVSSQSMKKDFLDFYEELNLSSKIFVIKEGVNLEKFKISEKYSILHKEKIKFIYPAALWPHKNHSLFVRALGQSKIKDFSEIQFTGYTFDKANWLRNHLRENGVLNYKINGVIELNHLIDLYRDSDVVVSCSLYESSSLPLIEGIASGCLVLASDIKPHLEMSKEMGLVLFESNSVLSLANKLDYLLENFEKLKLQYNNNQTKVVTYDWKVLAESYWENFEIEVGKYAKN